MFIFRKLCETTQHLSIFFGGTSGDWYVETMTAVTRNHSRIKIPSSYYTNRTTDAIATCMDAYRLYGCSQTSPETFNIRKSRSKICSLAAQADLG